MRPRWPWFVLLLMGGIAAGVAWFWVDHRQVCARWASMQLSDAEAMQQLRLKPGRYNAYSCLLYTSPSPRDATLSRMPSSA